MISDPVATISVKEVFRMLWNIKIAIQLAPI